VVNLAESYDAQIRRFGLLDEASPIGTYTTGDNWKYMRRFSDGPFQGPHAFAGFQSWAGFDDFGQAVVAAPSPTILDQIAATIGLSTGTFVILAAAGVSLVIIYSQKAKKEY
jgi:hypothetical protein